MEDEINKKITETTVGDNVKFSYYDEMLKHNTMSNDQINLPNNNKVIFNDVEITSDILKNTTIKKIYNFNYE